MMSQGGFAFALFLVGGLCVRSSFGARKIHTNSMHEEYYAQVMKPALSKGQDHRAFSSDSSPGASLEEQEIESAVGSSMAEVEKDAEDGSPDSYEDSACDVCDWAVQYIASKCCEGNPPVCDPHSDKCEKYVTFTKMQRKAEYKYKKESCWDGKGPKSGYVKGCKKNVYDRQFLFNRIWNDITGLGNLLKLWERYRPDSLPGKRGDSITAKEVCRDGATESFDCIGEITPGLFLGGQMNRPKLPNHDVDISGQRDRVCKGVTRRKSDVLGECNHNDRRCIKTAGHWKSVSFCKNLGGSSFVQLQEEEDLLEDVEDISTSEEQAPETEPTGTLEDVPEEVTDMLTHDELGFPEVEIEFNARERRWDLKSKIRTSSERGMIDACLKPTKGHTNLTEFLGGGSGSNKWGSMSGKMVANMCIFLYKYASTGSGGTWYLENIPSDVTGMLKMLYSTDKIGAAKATGGAVFKASFLNNLQNIGYGTGKVNLANSVYYSDKAKKGVHAYEDPRRAIKKDQIEHYMKGYKVDLHDVLGMEDCGDATQCTSEAVRKYEDYNHFFYRKMAANRRKFLCYSQDAAHCAATVDPDERQDTTLVSPADGRVVAFTSLDPAKTGMWVKGERFLLENMVKFGQDTDYRYYDGGTIMIVRLAPQDYHRFHMPVDGNVTSFENYPGNYFSVSPVAIQSPGDKVLSTNKRMHTTIDSGEDNFGCVTYISVGATNVGSVIHTSYVGQKVVRGMEHGYMAFGGSTVIVVVRKGVMKLNSEITQLSSLPVETIVHLGDKLGDHVSGSQAPAGSTNPCGA